jgi:hypothetical protein
MQIPHAAEERHLQKHRERARQLSASASSLLQSLHSTQDLPDNVSWSILQPALRLLLWLLPQHLPSADSSTELQPSTLIQAAAAAGEPFGQQATPSAAPQNPSRQAASLPPPKGTAAAQEPQGACVDLDAGWRQTSARLFAQDVATVGLVLLLLFSMDNCCALAAELWKRCYTTSVLRFALTVLLLLMSLGILAGRTCQDCCGGVCLSDPKPPLNPRTDP